MRELQALNTALEVRVVAPEAEQKHWLERWVLEEKLEQRIEQLTQELEAEHTRPTCTKSKETDTQTSDKEDGSEEDASSVISSVPKPMARVTKISSFSGAVMKDNKETIDWTNSILSLAFLTGTSPCG